MTVFGDVMAVGEAVAESGRYCDAGQVVVEYPGLRRLCALMGDGEVENHCTRADSEDIKWWQCVDFG
ncbi:hypothetical protein PDG61_20810 [Mycolicibacterium sp. BiH015]|nr:hypothetical protein [Mycolicibacterium sp. BiH015]